MLMVEKFSQEEAILYWKKERIISQPLATSVHIIVLSEKITSDMVHVSQMQTGELEAS